MIRLASWFDSFGWFDWHVGERKQVIFVRCHTKVKGMIQFFVAIIVFLFIITHFFCFFLYLLWKNRIRLVLRVMQEMLRLLLVGRKMPMLLIGKSRIKNQLLSLKKKRKQLCEIFYSNHSNTTTKICVGPHLMTKKEWAFFNC